MLIPFICRHFYGLPRTARNCAFVRQNLNDWLYAVWMMFSLLCGAFIAYAVSVGVFSFHP